MKFNLVPMLAAVGAMTVIGAGAVAMSLPNTYYDVRVYENNKDGTGKAMAAYTDGPYMYDFRRINAGKTEFCLADTLLKACYLTSDGFNPRSNELQRLKFEIEM